VALQRLSAPIAKQRTATSRTVDACEVPAHAGGLGSFGAQGMTSSAITGAIADIRALTDAPFAINLWVSTEDEGAREVDVRRYQAALAALAPLFDELGAELPDAGPHSWPTLADQIGAILDARPPVFSFVFDRS
jgi:nitronate monooxygenase